jgi:acyl-CoA thioester hydrolase
MLSGKTEIRVRFADTDQMGIVYNGKYLEYFEVGRTEMLRSNGLAYSEVERRGYQLPLLEAHVKYISPARYDDVLVIEALVKDYPAFRIHIDYKITVKEKDALIAEGFTKHVFMSKETLKLVRPPKFFTEAIDQFYYKK